MSHSALAQLLFPDVCDTVQDLEATYPLRTLPEGAKVTRMAPSPTGFMHLGNLYGAIADERLAHQSDGVFLLRIEDTDQKREVEGGVETILSVFDAYELPFDEGATLTGDNGAYGPYRQRQRAHTYHICAKWLVEQGKAYPCFLTEEELTSMREEQAEQKLDFGCYGRYARYRAATLDDIQARLDAGQPYVIRYRSEGNVTNRTKVTDLVRGVLELPENTQDTVLLKSDGIPTYHFAHVVDDHFMHTTHVVRGEEWLATLPIHVQLFAAMGWRAPKYLHTAHLMKLDGGGKRKLSKRKDPELALDFYKQAGYPVVAVKEYLLSLLNSNFEEWRTANPDKSLNEFPFSIKKMGVSGALFDINKLDDVSRGVICRMDAPTVFGLLAAWADEFDQPFAALLRGDEAYATAILSIGRCTPKLRKDITLWSGVKEYMSFFYDELFRPTYTLPDTVTREKAHHILAAYGDIYGPNDDTDVWFNKIKAIADSIGFASNMKEYRASPEAFGGSVADVSAVIRVAVTGRTQSPDLYEVMRIMGPGRIQRRMQMAADIL